MSETRERFDAGAEINEYFFSAIKKVTGIIPVIKEQADINKRLSNLEKESKQIEEQIKSLKISLELVTEDNVKKSLKELISIKQKELDTNDDEADRLNTQLSDCNDEMSEYNSYIDQVYSFTDGLDLINEDDINFEEFSLPEFIAFLFLYTNGGEYNFPNYSRGEMPAIFDEVLFVIKENNWNKFIEWIEKTDIKLTEN